MDAGDALRSRARTMTEDEEELGSRARALSKKEDELEQRFLSLKNYQAEEVAKILRYDSGFYGTLGCVRAENGVAVITRSTASDSAAEAVPLLGVTFERTNGSVLADLDAPLTAVLGSTSRSSPPVLVCAVSKYDD